MKTNNRDIFQITEVNRTVLKRSCTKETLDIQNCSLDSPDDDAMDDGSSHDAFEPKGGTFSTRATQREKALKNEVTISI